MHRIFLDTNKNISSVRAQVLDLIPNMVVVEYLNTLHSVLWKPLKVKYNSSMHEYLTRCYLVTQSAFCNVNVYNNTEVKTFCVRALVRNFQQESIDLCEL